MCLCSDDEAGHNRHRRGKKFLAHVKGVCPPKSLAREDIAAGMLVVRLIGRSKSYEALVSEEAPDIVDVWYHVGLMYLSPFEPTFMQVAPVADPGETSHDPRRVYIESGHKYLSLYEGLAPFEDSDIVSARWYRLEEASRPIASVAPRIVPVLEMRGFSSSEQYWPRRVPTRRAGHGGDPGEGGGPSDDAPADGDSDESPDEGEADAAAVDEHEFEFEPLLHPLLMAYDAELELPRLVEDVGVADSSSLSVPDASVVVAEPPPPLPPPVDAPPETPTQRQRARRGGELSVPFAGGVIIYYPSNGNFEARCTPHICERCTLTKKSVRAASSSSSAPPANRPLVLFGSVVIPRCPLPRQGGAQTANRDRPIARRGRASVQVRMSAGACEGARR